MKVLIIGRNGQLAKELKVNKPDNIDILCLGRNEVDITKLDEIRTKIEEIMPEVVINASAYTAVDKAESDKEMAFSINEHAVRNLAQVCKNIGCKFLHVSTDFIFDGTSNTAYEIDSLPNPKSVYGASKLGGELAIKKYYPEGSSIIRTSWLYSTFGNNFVKSMLKLMNDKQELGIVVDQIGCPTYAKGLAAFLWQLAVIEETELVYHWSDSGVASWYDFAVAIQELAVDKGLLKYEIPIHPIRTSGYPTPAKRPAFSVLDKSNAEAVSNLDAIHWRRQLSSMLDEFLPLDRS